MFLNYDVAPESVHYFCLGVLSVIRPPLTGRLVPATNGSGAERVFE